MAGIWKGGRQPGRRAKQTKAVSRRDCHVYEEAKRLNWTSLFAELRI